MAECSWARLDAAILVRKGQVEVCCLEITKEVDRKQWSGSHEPACQSKIACPTAQSRWTAARQVNMKCRNHAKLQPFTLAVENDLFFFFFFLAQHSSTHEALFHMQGITNVLC